MSTNDYSQPYLAAEGAVLEWLQGDESLRGIAPGCVARDVWRGALVMEHVEETEAPQSDSHAHGGERAALIARLHKRSINSRIPVTQTLPPIFSVICRGVTMRPDVLARFWKLMRRPAIVRQLVAEAAASWCRVSLVHTDIKHEHWKTRGAATPELCLLDWELVRFGDPAWDLASLLHDEFVFGARVNGHHLPASAVKMLVTYRNIAGQGIWNTGFERRVALNLGTRILQTALESLTSEDVRSAVAMLQHAELVCEHVNELQGEIAIASLSQPG